jgi:hypothetical protein
MIGKDNVRYFKGGNKFVGIRCPICEEKRFVKEGVGTGCGNGCAEIGADAQESEIVPVHLGELEKGDE